MTIICHKVRHFHTTKSIWRQSKITNVSKRFVYHIFKLSSWRFGYVKIDQHLLLEPSIDKQRELSCAPNMSCWNRTKKLLGLSTEHNWWDWVEHPMNCAPTTVPDTTKLFSCMILLVHMLRRRSKPIWKYPSEKFHPTCRIYQTLLLLISTYFGHIKSLVYANKPATLDDLKDNIQREIANFPVEMCTRVVENWVQ